MSLHVCLCMHACHAHVCVHARTHALSGENMDVAVKPPASYLPGCGPEAACSRFRGVAPFLGGRLAEDLGTRLPCGKTPQQGRPVLWGPHPRPPRVPLLPAMAAEPMLFPSPAHPFPQGVLPLSYPRDPSAAQLMFLTYSVDGVNEHTDLFEMHLPENHTRYGPPKGTAPLGSAPRPATLDPHGPPPQGFLLAVSRSYQWGRGACRERSSLLPAPVTLSHRFLILGSSLILLRLHLLSGLSSSPTCINRMQLRT